MSDNTEELNTNDNANKPRKIESHDSIDPDDVSLTESNTNDRERARSIRTSLPNSPVADKEDTPAEDTKQDEEGGAGSSGGGPADNAAENVESTPAEGATAEGDDKEKEDEPKADSAAIDEEGGGGGDGAPQEQVAPPSNDAESNADKSSVVDKSDKSTVESEAQSNETAPAPTRSDSVQLPDRIEEDDEFEDEGRGNSRDGSVSSKKLLEELTPPPHSTAKTTLEAENERIKNQQCYDINDASLMARMVTSSPPIADTPDNYSLNDDQTTDPAVNNLDLESVPEYDRNEMLEQYHKAIRRRQELKERNNALQRKLADYFRKKRHEEAKNEVNNRNTADQEQRYIKLMSSLDSLRRQERKENEQYTDEIAELSEKCDYKQKRVNEEKQKFTEFKSNICQHSINSRSGKTMSLKDIEAIFSNEAKKEVEVANVRLENIKLKNKLKKKELQLKSKEELAAGLHLIDFEQLKIENQTYNEKIEERNEELLKLRKKITCTVQVLTHLKEKLQFVTGENLELKIELDKVDQDAANQRDILSRTKQARDSLRIDNQKLRGQCGLLANKSLLRDYEERVDESADLSDRIAALTGQHAELTMNLNTIRLKINQANSQNSARRL